MNEIVIAGGTGYIGLPLIEKLQAAGRNVKAIARRQSLDKVPAGCEAITGDVLDCRTYRDQITPGSTFVHLVGVAHPAPWKEREFRAIDLASLKESVAAAKYARVEHFVFVSVAHPAPVMKAYIRVRVECEEILRASGFNVTILRPWYVLGPGHRWPYVLIPFYKFFELIPATRESALRLRLVTRAQMVDALAGAAIQGARGVVIHEWD